MRPEEIDDFLGIAPEPKKSVSEKFLEDSAQSKKSNDNIDDFLSGRTQTPQKRQKLSKEMTHQTFTPTDYSIRPEIITENIKKGFAGFASLPGYAVDAVDWAVKDTLGPVFEKMGASTTGEPIGGSAQIRKGYELLTDYQAVEPRNPSEKYAGKAAEFVGAGIPMSYKMLVTDAVKMAATGLSKQQIASELSKTAATDLASGTFAGISSQYSGDVFADALGEDWRPVGEMFGGAGGGMTPWYAKNVVGGTANVRQAIKDPALKENLLENRAKQEIEGAMGESPQATQNLEQAAGLQKKIEGFNPNIAAAADSPGLTAFQKGLDEASVANYNRSARMIEGSKEAINKYYRSVMPQLDDQITPFLKGRFEGAVKKVKVRVTTIDKKISNLEKTLSRKPSREVGNRLRVIKEQRYESVKAEKNQKYSDLYKAADEVGVKADIADIREMVIQIEKSSPNAFQSMPRIYDKVKSVLPTEDTVTASFPKIHSLMKAVNTEYGKALLSGDSNKEYLLSKLRPILKSKIEGFDDPVYGSFASHKQAVDSWWRSEYYSVFKQGLGVNINRKTKWGDRTPDEDVVKTYVLGKGSEGIDQFNKVFKGVPEAQVLLRDGIIDSLAEKIRTSGFKQKVIDDFLNKNREVMDRLPDLRNTLSDTSVAVNVLSKRKAEVLDMQKNIISMNNNVHAKAAGFDSIEEAVFSAVRDKKVMNVMLRSAKTDIQKQNLATGFAEHILSQKKPWEYLAENEKTIKPVLNKLGANHYNNLKDISDAYKIMDRYQLPTHLIRGAGSLDPMKEATGTSFISAFAQFRWAFFYGKTSKVYPFVDIGAKYLFKQGQKAVDKLIEKAMYDPDLAKTLANLTKRKDIPLKVWDTLSEKMLGVRLRATGVVAEDVSQSLDEQFKSEIQQ